MLAVMTGASSPHRPTNGGFRGDLPHARSVVTEVGHAIPVQG